MIKKLILKIQKETDLEPYDIMQAFVYGAIWALVLILSIYPFFWILTKIVEMLGIL